MKKRVLSFLVLALALCMTLAACGGTAGSSSAAGSEPAAADSATRSCTATGPGTATPAPRSGGTPRPAFCTRDIRTGRHGGSRCARAWLRSQGRCRCRRCTKARQGWAASGRRRCRSSRKRNDDSIHVNRYPPQRPEDPVIVVVVGVASRRCLAAK